MPEKKLIRERMIRKAFKILFWLAFSVAIAVGSYLIYNLIRFQKWDVLATWATILGLPLSLVVVFLGWVGSISARIIDDIDMLSSQIRDIEARINNNREQIDRTEKENLLQEKRLTIAETRIESFDRAGQIQRQLGELTTTVAQIQISLIENDSRFKS